MPKQLIGDVVRNRQILMNLVTNAVKYTERGKVTLKISGDVEGTDCRLQCAVVDTGIGIKPEDIDAIKEKDYLSVSSYFTLLKLLQKK